MSHRRFLVAFGRANVNKKGERLRVSNGSGSTEVPVRYLEALVCVGSANMSAEAINLLTLNRVPVYFMSKFGTLKGSLLPQTISSRNKNRLNQYGAFKNKRLKVACRIVIEKILSVERLYELNLSAAKRRVSKARSIEELMGIEGEVSRKMFDKFRENIAGSSLDFKGRSYRPPTDPVNALLSLSYTLAYSLALPLVLFLGYDPYISFLHSKRGTHASFCSDVIEPVRPIITKRLEEPINLKTFSEKDFLKSGKGFYLKKDSYNKFLNWFEGIKDEVLEAIKASLVGIGDSMR